jgi:hypothetical protein
LVSICLNLRSFCIFSSLFRWRRDQYLFDSSQPSLDVSLLQTLQKSRCQITNSVGSPGIDPSAPDLIDCVSQEFSHVRYRTEDQGRAIVWGKWAVAVPAASLPT